MKTIAFLPISLLLFACASSDDLSGGRTLDCSSGQALEVRAGIDQQGFERGGATSGAIVFIVEVANNSHEDITVERLGVKSRRFEGGAFQDAYKTVNQQIVEGTEHVFEIPTTTFVRLPRRDPQRDPQIDPEEYEFSVLVNLTNGDQYLCHFRATWGRR